MDKVTSVGRGFDPKVEFLHGRFVIEVRQGGYDKGAAVDAFMRSALFAERRPVFLGDDVTDEDGFRAARAAGGLAIAVGPRPTMQADFNLAGPPEVRALLGRIAAPAERVA